MLSPLGPALAEPTRYGQCTGQDCGENLRLGWNVADQPLRLPTRNQTSRPFARLGAMHRLAPDTHTLIYGEGRPGLHADYDELNRLLGFGNPTGIAELAHDEVCLSLAALDQLSFDWGSIRLRDRVPTKLASIRKSAARQHEMMTAVNTPRCYRKIAVQPYCLTSKLEPQNDVSRRPKSI